MSFRFNAAIYRRARFSTFCFPGQNSAAWFPSCLEGRSTTWTTMKHVYATSAETSAQNNMINTLGLPTQQFSAICCQVLPSRSLCASSKNQNLPLPILVCLVGLLPVHHKQIPKYTSEVIEIIKTDIPMKKLRHVHEILHQSKALLPQSEDTWVTPHQSENWGQTENQQLHSSV